MEEQAEQHYREAAEGGDLDAMIQLRWLLQRAAGGGSGPGEAAAAAEVRVGRWRALRAMPLR
ncbi:hypothetical protein ACWEKM_35450 [Streptomyces sp. NPDC004752]